VPLPARVVAPGLRIASGVRRAVGDDAGASVELTLATLGRYAYYRSAKARDDLDFRPRALRETLADTLRWLRQTGRFSR
jgi:nucleoside-diphosphate-sugar epimerase